MTGHSLLQTPEPSSSGPPASGLDIVHLVDQLLGEGQSEIYRKVVQAVDLAVVQTVLRHTKGNQIRASELLGISRTTLRAKLRTLGMTIEKQLAQQSISGLP